MKKNMEKVSVKELMKEQINGRRQLRDFTSANHFTLRQLQWEKRD